MMTQEQRLDAMAAAHKARIDSYCRRVVDEGHLDADTGLFLAGELTHVSAEMVRFAAQPNQIRGFIPPVPDQPGEAATHYDWSYLTRAGEAMVTTSLAGESPRALVERTGPNSVNLVWVREAYSYADDEVMQIAYSGLPLSREKPLACREIIDNGREELLWHGSTTMGVTGFLSEAAVNNIVNPGGALSTLNAANLYSFYMTQLNNAKLAVGDLGESYFPDTVILPLAEKLRAKTLYFDTTSGKSVFDKVCEDSGIPAARWFTDRHMNTSGTGTTQQLIMFPSKPDVVGYIMPVEYAELAPQRRGYETIVEARSRVGGCAWRRPKLGRKVYGL